LYDVFTDTLAFRHKQLGYLIKGILKFTSRFELYKKIT